jgi:hypothetical protein
VLPILKYDQASHFELATNRTQPNSAAADVEGMDKFRIGFAGNIIARDSYRQYRLGPLQTPLIADRRFCVCCQSRQSFI